MIRRFASMGVAGVAMIGILCAIMPPAAADPPRRVSISGTVYMKDDENWPDTDEYCHYGVTDNDVVYTSQQVVIDQNWGCDGEVNTQLYASVDLLSDPPGAIRYHGEVILREGNCGCTNDRIRKQKSFNQVVMPSGNAEVATGIISWGGGDETEVRLQVYNSSP